MELNKIDFFSFPSNPLGTLTLMLLVSIGLVTSEQQLRFSLKKKNINYDYSLDVTTLNLILSYPHFFLNCPKQRGLIFGESGLVG